MRFQHLTKSSSIGSNKIGVGVMYEGFGLDQRLHRANSDIVGTNEWELGALLEPPNPRWLHVHSFCWSGIKFKWSVLKLAPKKKKNVTVHLKTVMTPTPTNIMLEPMKLKLVRCWTLKPTLITRNITRFCVSLVIIDSERAQNVAYDMLE